MIYGQISGVEKPVSRIVYGTANDAFWKGEDCSSLLNDIVQNGINTFDTARVYGNAEHVLGNWLAKRSDREKLVILSKGGHPAAFIPRMSERCIRADLNRSLAELQTDYIDIYLLHRDNPSRPAGEYVELLNSFHAEGKIRAFGGSNWTHRRIEEANEYAYKKGLVPFTVSSPYFGLANMKGDPFGNGAVSIAGPSHSEARTWYEESGMAVVAYSVLGRGFFSGRVHKPSDMKGWARRGFATKENFERLRRCEQLAENKGCSVAQLALAWMLSNPLNGFAIVSVTSPSRLEQNTAALGIELSREEIDWLDLK